MRAHFAENMGDQVAHARGPGARGRRLPRHRRRLGARGHALLAGRDADADRRSRRRRDRARRGDGAARAPQRVRPAPACCRCGSPTSACAAATSPAPASSRCAPSTTTTSSATRACSSGRCDRPHRVARPATSTSSGGGRPTPPCGWSGWSSTVPSRATPGRSSSALEAIVALEDGDVAAVEAKLAAAYVDRRGRRPTCRSSPWSAPSPPRSPPRAGRAAEAAETPRRRGGAARSRGSLQPGGRAPARALRAELGDDAFEARLRRAATR